MVIRVKHKYIFFFQHIILCKQSVALRIPCNCPYNFPLIYFITTLNFVRARSRSIKHERALLYSHLIATFLPLYIDSPLFEGFPLSFTPLMVYQLLSLTSLTPLTSITSLTPVASSKTMVRLRAGASGLPATWTNALRAAIIEPV